jgi:hypothetical protein
MWIEKMERKKNCIEMALLRRLHNVVVTTIN